ncbi:related to Conserved oligomeric Golgi complex subunit 3 [Saccharomycodes ludwigii]|uniref:Conserved oligomeric Golgi complex subunit 3 n=1 Tax=Saccharomycodes ludwigii TaxID=36035 RepID=A0A376B7N1_9ASCO|nr:hypothetical protein SCDLUD_001640 [Saccharomycodes ludwigii]KAH3901857.1 hypothetical protein SCDLUD_001640 [Saccharomycodes ludwigii]SSD60130.1 related to Conserved oligomeric Golgi complex subunit 3 [Saccharomycodes ludwigii]
MKSVTSGRVRSQSIVSNIATSQNLKEDDLLHPSYKVPAIGSPKNLSLFKEKLKLLQTLLPNTNNNKNLFEEEFQLQAELEDDTSGRSNEYVNLIESFIDNLNSKNVNEYNVINEQVNSINNSFSGLAEKLDKLDIQHDNFYQKVGVLYEQFENLTLEKNLVSDYLKMFENLQYVNKKLVTFNFKFVNRRKDKIEEILNTIINSIVFLQNHTEFKSYDSYKFKFKQSLNKVCELITKYLNSVLLKGIVEDVTIKLGNISDTKNLQVSKSSKEILLYNKFSQANYSSIYYEIIGLLTDCIKALNNEQYYCRELEKDFLKSCYTNFQNARYKLLHPLIWLQLDEIIVNDKNSNTLVKFIQDNVLYFSSIFEKEFVLFNKFFPDFPSKTDIVNNWFETLCEPFYDSFRIRVLRENSIPILCDCISLLNKYYEFEEGSMEYELQFSQIKLNKLFEPILRDVQSRLVFKAQLYVETNVINYKPSLNEFIIANNKELDKDEMVQQFLDSCKISMNIKAGNVDDKEDHETNPDIILTRYYKPMIKALALLSKIYQMVSSSIFDDLAHHILHDCITSLKTAFEISINRNNNIDIILAYLSNLLFLRDQIECFDIQYISNEVYLDFTTLGAFWNTITRQNMNNIDNRNSSSEGHNMVNNSSSVIDGGRKSSTISLFSLARDSVPKVVNNMIDARTELMTELRNAVNIFTETCGKSLIGDCFTHLENGKLNEREAKLILNLEDGFQKIYKQIKMFIIDQSITNHLLDAIQEYIVESYNVYYNSLTTLLSSSSSAVTVGFSEKEVADLMYVDVFNEYLTNIIQKLKST